MSLPVVSLHYPPAHRCALTGYSGLDADSALYLLSRIMKHFVDIIAEEARSLPDGDGEEGILNLFF